VHWTRTWALLRQQVAFSRRELQFLQCSSTWAQRAADVAVRCSVMKSGQTTVYYSVSPRTWEHSWDKQLQSVTVLCSNHIDEHSSQRRQQVALSLISNRVLKLLHGFAVPTYMRVERSADKNWFKCKNTSKPSHAQAHFAPARLHTLPRPQTLSTL